MEIVYEGKKINTDEVLEEGAKELDMLTNEDEDKKEDTIEITEEELNAIKEMMGEKQ